MTINQQLTLREGAQNPLQFNGSMTNAVTPQAPMAPNEFTLCPCKPIRLNVQAESTLTLQGAEVASHSGLEFSKGGLGSLARSGQLAGAVVMSGAQTRIEVQGRSRPRMANLLPWRQRAVSFTDGDSLRLHSHRDAVVMIWPYVRGVPLPAIVTALITIGNAMGQL